jgi:hypothetical protein
VIRFARLKGSRSFVTATAFLLMERERFILMEREPFRRA